MEDTIAPSAGSSLCRGAALHRCVRACLL